MASPILQKLECSICLELFKVPVTLPCGHNFCQSCIKDHWDKQEQVPSGAEKGYKCPQCRRALEQRPFLEKNITLCNVVELARDGEARVPGTERCEVAQGELCPQHGHLLELYCEEERRCICCACTVGQCQQHRRVLLEEERSKKQALLKESLEKAQGESERIKQAMQKLEEQTISIKDSSEEVKSTILSKFALLKKALEDCQWQTVARIEQEQAAVLRRVEEDWSLLKDHLDLLTQHREKAQQLLACPSHRTFLQEFPLLPSLESPEVLIPREFNAANVVKPIAEILTDVSRLLLEDLPGSVASKTPDPIGQGPVQPKGLMVKVVAPLPECQVRAELLKALPIAFPKYGEEMDWLRDTAWLGKSSLADHRNLTFDPRTANKHLKLSKDNRKAKHSPRAICEQPEQGPRFKPWQVLCTQGYGHGHHYWEVKVSSHSVVLGVTYRSLPWEQQQGQKFNIGLNGDSWGLQVLEDCYLAWHKGQREKIQEQLYKNLGVSLDCSKGLLSFYGLGKTTQLIYSFHSVFTEPLYPVFWLCEGRTVMLCQWE